MRFAHALALVALLTSAAAPPADAAVRSVFSGSSGQHGTLRVESDGGDTIVVACIGGQVHVNGGPPDSGPLECWRAQRIEVLGGPGDNRIDLGGIRPSEPGASRGVNSSTRVDAGAGDDAVIGPSGGRTTIVGGPGSDWIQTQSGSIDTYEFGPAAAPERDTIVEPGWSQCDPSYVETDQPGTTWWTVPWDALDFTALAADDPLVADERTPGGVLASHRNRIVHAADAPGIAFEAIAGGAGNDRIAGACMVVGGEGDDTLVGTASGDLLLGGAGTDGLFGGTGIDKLSGGPGDDELDGSHGADALEGGSGDDLLRGGKDGDVYLFAGDDGVQRDSVQEVSALGVDVLSFDLQRTSPVAVDLSGSSGVVARAAGLEVRAEPHAARALEGVIGGRGNDRLLGNDRSNHFWTGGGTDYAAGRGGNDVYYVDWTASMPYAAYAWGEFWGGPFARAEPGRFVGGGRAFLRIAEVAGGGFDTVDVSERWIESEDGASLLEGQLSRGVRIDLNAARWIVRAPSVGALAADRRVARHLEGVRGSTYADTIVGNAVANRLDGGEGRDRISGGAGRDVCVTDRAGDRLSGCELVRRGSRRR